MVVRAIILWLTLYGVSSKLIVPSSVTPVRMMLNTRNNDTTISESKLGVLFLNLGGPHKLQDVEGFLYNLFSDPDIIRLPKLLSFLQKPLAFAIARSRAPKSSHAYASIGGGSPILKYTQAQSDLVETALRARGKEFESARCYFAMRYWHPFTDEVLQRIQNDGVNMLVIVPLYPQYSISTSGSSLGLLEKAFAARPDKWGLSKVTHTVVPSWYNRPGYIRALSRLLLRELRSFNEEQMKEGIHVLFSAHGVPQSYIAAGDPYQRQIEECVRLVAQDVAQLLRTTPNVYRLKDEKRISDKLARLLAGPFSSSKYSSSALYSSDSTTRTAVDQQTGAPEIQYHLSFQSRVGPVKWLQPYTDDMLKRLGTEEGVRNLVVVPISFVSEHIETLEEIDMEYKELALSSGVTQWRRVPALNTDELFIKDLADLVEETLHLPIRTLSEVSVSNKTYLASQAEIGSSSSEVTAAEHSPSVLIVKTENNSLSSRTGVQSLLPSAVTLLSSATAIGCIFVYALFIAN